MSQATGVKAASTMDSDRLPSQAQPGPEQIRERAYEIYLSRNGTPGDHVQDWLQAENELRSKQP